ncbi:MAG: hypothetical protein AMXMBFR33_61890 [Candidatus Xenobia bacterium]
MIKATLGAVAIAFAATAHATNPPESPPGASAGAHATGGDSTAINFNAIHNSSAAHVGNVSARGGNVGNVSAGGGNVGNVSAGGGAGGSAAVTTGAVSQQGGNVNVQGPVTNMRAGAVTFSATQPPPVAGGSIGISVSNCLPFKHPNGNEGYREVKVGSETWFIGRETADAAGNFGKSNGTNVGAMGLLIGGQYGTASGDNAPGWISLERECIALKQQAPPPPPPPAATPPPPSELTIQAPSMRAVQRKIPCKVERFTDSKGKQVDMCRGPAGSWTKTDVVQSAPMTVRVAPTTKDTQVVPSSPGTTVELQGDSYLLGSNAPPLGPPTP